MDYQAIIEALDARTLEAFQAWGEKFSKGMKAALALSDAAISELAKRAERLEAANQLLATQLVEAQALMAKHAEATQKQVHEAVAIAVKALPGVTYRGVYDPDAEYQRGDMLTHDGSVWHCNEPVTGEKPGGTKAFTLAVKRGRDGRDAKGAE